MRQRLVTGVSPELVVARRARRGRLSHGLPKRADRIPRNTKQKSPPTAKMQVDGVFSAVPQVRLELTLDGL
jgi:hypothetical protein